jgi:chromatin structure-remodeling complex subunit RSC9
LGDEGAPILGKSKRVKALIFDTLEKFQVPNDSKLEFLLTALDLFRYTIRHWPAPPTPQQVQCLVAIVGLSQDRAILISGWYGLHNLLDTFTTVMHVTPTSEALEAAIRVLPLHIDPHLVGAALDYILAHISNPSLAKAFLHHKDMPQVLKLLAHQLLWDQNKVLESITVTIGVPPKTAIAQNNAIGMLELTKEELDELAPLTEPSRVTKWYVQSPSYTECHAWLFTA